MTTLIIFSKYLWLPAALQEDVRQDLPLLQGASNLKFNKRNQLKEGSRVEAMGNWEEQDGKL